MGDRKTIIINCYKVPLGRHNITLPNATKAKLQIGGTSERPKCSLSYIAKDVAGSTSYRLVDENCDGHIDLVSYKRAGDKVWTDSRDIAGFQLQNNTYSFRNLFTNAFGALVPGFTFNRSTPRLYRDCKTGEPVKLTTPQAAIDAGTAYGGTYKGRGIGSISIVTPDMMGISLSKRATKTVNAEIHFGTGKADLSTSAKRRLERFAHDYEGGEIVVEGHCDPRGSSEYNFELGKTRASAAADYLEEELRKLRKRAAISTISFGESMAAGRSYEGARRAVIAAGEVPLKRALDKVKGNPYLIDASGSMTDVWKMVRGYQFPKGTEIYSFNGCVGVTKGLVLWPDCGTPLWKSLYRLIQETKEGTIVVITDGGDTEGFPDGVDLDKLIAMAKERRIKVSTVFIGTPHTETEQVMLKISTATGGSFYLRTR